MSALRSLPKQLRGIVKRELRDGESVTWAGQPIPRRMARKSLPLVLFAVPWTAFSVFLVATGFADAPESSWFPISGLPFVLIGIGMLSAPLWTMRLAARTAYVLTDQRALIASVTLRGSTTVRSFDPKQLRSIERTEHADRSGDLVFHNDVSRDSDGEQRSTSVGFLGVPEVKQVHERVRQLRPRKRRPASRAEKTPAPRVVSEREE